MNTKGNSLWVKICGVQDRHQALAAVAAGADAIGLVFAASSRQLSLTAAGAISRALPASIQRVGVFVDADPVHVRHCYHSCKLNWVQLHGHEDLAYCRALNLPMIKAFRLTSEAELANLTIFRSYPLLVDAPRPGSGQTINWQLAATAASLHPRLILAGGLHPDNVSQAIAQVQPYGVDVSSGVEGAAGQKDPAKIASFVQAARRCSLARELQTDA